MGLASQLSYVYPRPNAFHRAMQRLGSTRPGAWFFSKTLAPADRVLGTLTNGRITVPAIMARLPVLVLTSTGRKTKQPRQTHLIAVPFDDKLALLGTNFGQAATPTWVLNLEADARATVTHRGVTRPVVARPATDVESREVLANSAAFYPGYAKYRQRITARRLRIFILEDAAEDPS